MFNMLPREKPTISKWVRPIAGQYATQCLVSTATVDGVSPDDLPNPRVVEEDDVVLRSEPVCHLRVPVIHMRGDIN